MKDSIVVVGGGTMGLFLAHELMLRGKKIILIESGNEQSQSFGQDEYKNLGHAHAGIAIGRAKGIGGTTNLWGGQLTQFLPIDIESKGNFGQPDWIISWNELEEYYSKTYKKLGFHEEVSDYVERLDTWFGKSIEFFYTHWLKQPNFKNHFYKELKESDLVTVYENTTVTNLNFSGEKCIGVDISANGKTEKINDFDKIVLANGTFEICRLLLTVAKRANCPFSDNQWIGKYYQDHISLRMGVVQNASKEFFKKFSNVIRDGKKLQPKIRLNLSEPDSKYIGVSGYFSFSSDVTQHLDNFKQFAKAVMGRSQDSSSLKDKALLFIKVIKALPQIMPLIFRYLKDNQIYVPFNSKIILCVQAQQISIKDSEVTISKNELDENGRFKVLLNWKLDGREFDSIKEFCIKLESYLKSNQLGNVVFDDWFNEESENRSGKWLNQVGDIYHQAGAVIMSRSKEEGVIDENLRIHETNNIFVCGPCVLPTSSYANTGLTALALTYRLAEHISI
jgi:choline dehydrogenase-like flavoprotein